MKIFCQVRGLEEQVRLRQRPSHLMFHQYDIRIVMNADATPAALLSLYIIFHKQTN